MAVETLKSTLARVDFVKAGLRLYAECHSFGSTSLHTWPPAFTSTMPHVSTIIRESAWARLLKFATDRGNNVEILTSHHVIEPYQQRVQLPHPVTTAIASNFTEQKASEPRPIIPVLPLLISVMDPCVSVTSTLSTPNPGRELTIVADRRGLGASSMARIFAQRNAACF